MGGYGRLRSDWVKGRVTVAYHHLWEQDTFKKVVDNNILRYNIPCAVNTYMTANGVTFNMWLNDSLVVSALKEEGGCAISSQTNLELHLGCHTCHSWLSYFTFPPVVRTDGRAVGVRSRDYQIFSDE